MRLAAALFGIFVGVATATTQEVPLEYRVKAAYLYNLVKFVEWPPRASAGPIAVCVAGRNPFGTVLEETLRGEAINGRPLQARVILEPEPGCHVLFVPAGAATSAYLRAARGTPTLTVGETADFRQQGGIVTFLLDEGNVRFAINNEAADQNGLRISSRLLRLAVETSRSER